MNWNQIELRWNEMTRRVQSPSSRPSPLQTPPSQNDTARQSRKDPEASNELTGRLNSGNSYE